MMVPTRRLVRVSPDLTDPPWRTQVGWVIGRRELLGDIQTALPYLQFCAATPMQEALVKVIRQAEQPYQGCPSYYRCVHDRGSLSRSTILDLCCFHRTILPADPRQSLVANDHNHPAPPHPDPPSLSLNKCPLLLAHTPLPPPPPSSRGSWLAHEFLAKRSKLAAALGAAGIRPMPAEGGFFLLGDISEVKIPEHYLRQGALMEGEEGGRGVSSFDCVGRSLMGGIRGRAYSRRDMCQLLWKGVS
jgi:hypothetical protein